MQSDAEKVRENLRKSNGLPVSLDEILEGTRGALIFIERLMSSGELVQDGHAIEHTAERRIIKIPMYRYTRGVPKRATPFSMFGFN